MLNFIDSSIKFYLIKMSMIGLLLIICAATFSIGFHNPDEHYQIIEFTGLKFGLTSENFLAWEYESKIRPWLQPAFYYQIAKALEFLGFTSPFTWALVFRLVTGLLSWITLFFMAVWVGNNVKNLSLAKFFIAILFTLCFIPYLSVRTSSENFSCIFLTLGFLAFTFSIPPKKFFLEKIKFLIVGILFGLSIAFRYQAGFAVFGFLLWMLFFDKSRIISTFQISVGILIPLILSVFVDYWGYGEWTFTSLNYFKKNIVEGVAASFGVSPFWYYPFLMLFHPMMPINFLFLIGVIIFWLRFLKHPVAWMTFCFFFFHSLVGHKELRFLLPILFLSLMGCFMAYQSVFETPGYWSIKLKRFRFSKLFCFLVCFNCISLFFLSFTNLRYEVTVQRYVYNHLSEEPIYIYKGALFPWAKFYKPRNYQEIPIKSLNEIGTLKSDFIITDSIPNAKEVLKKYPKAKILLRTLPAWMTKYNYLDWLSRTKVWSIIRLKHFD